MDMVTLATLTMLLVCCACTFYLLSCVWRILAALWRGFCAFANAADRAICYFTGDVPYEDAASWLETWRVKHEARRHAKTIPDVHVPEDESPSTEKCKMSNKLNINVLWVPQVSTSLWPGVYRVGEVGYMADGAVQLIGVDTELSDDQLAALEANGATNLHVSVLPYGSDNAVLIERKYMSYTFNVPEGFCETLAECRDRTGTVFNRMLHG